MCTWKWLKRFCFKSPMMCTFWSKGGYWWYHVQVYHHRDSVCPYSLSLSEHFYNQQTPYRGLPLKHTPLTSSIGSLITVADEDGAEEEVEELGRVAGWVASFDRLLADPLGVQCLLVSVCVWVSWVSVCAHAWCVLVCTNVFTFKNAWCCVCVCILICICLLQNTLNVCINMYVS